MLTLAKSLEASPLPLLLSASSVHPALPFCDKQQAQHTLGEERNSFFTNLFTIGHVKVTGILLFHHVNWSTKFRLWADFFFFFFVHSVKFLLWGYYFPWPSGNLGGICSGQTLSVLATLQLHGILLLPCRTVTAPDFQIQFINACAIWLFNSWHNLSVVITHFCNTNRKTLYYI